MLVCGTVVIGVEFTPGETDTERLREDGLMKGKMVVDCREAGQSMAKSCSCPKGELKAKGTPASFRGEQHLAMFSNLTIHSTPHLDFPWNLSAEIFNSCSVVS